MIVKRNLEDILTLYEAATTKPLANRFLSRSRHFGFETSLEGREHWTQNKLCMLKSPSDGASIFRASS